MYYILIFLLIITIITITVYLFTKSSSCKDNQKFLNNSCCDLTRIYKDKDNIEKYCQKDLCNNMCCRDDQICDSKRGLCQYTYDCNGYDCIVTKGGKYTEPTCGSKCPKRPTPSSSSSGSNIGITIGIVVGSLVVCLIVCYFIYKYSKIFQGTTIDLSRTPLHPSSRSY